MPLSLRPLQIRFEETSAPAEAEEEAEPQEELDPALLEPPPEPHIEAVASPAELLATADPEDMEPPLALDDPPTPAAMVPPVLALDVLPRGHVRNPPVSTRVLDVPPAVVQPPRPPRPLRPAPTRVVPRRAWAPSPTSYYPEAARLESVEGDVRVGLEIQAAGSVARTWVVRTSGDGRLDEAARRLALAARFHPMPRSTTGEMTVRFRLED